MYNEGDVISPKIANVKLMSEPKDGARPFGTLAKGEDLVYMGVEQDGYLSVESGAGSGWVRKALVTN